MQCARRPRSAARLLVLLGTALVIAVGSLVAQSDARVDDVLQRLVGFSTDDVRRLHEGAVVIESLDTPVREELAHVGMVFVNASSHDIIDRFRDIEEFERGPGVPQLGRFSDPPTYADLEGLTLPEADIESLRDCRPGDCEIQLPAAVIRRYQAEVDWSSPDATDQINHVTRDMVLELVRAYQAGGNEALGRYNDENDALVVAEQFQAILASTESLPTPIPALLTYLNDYPTGRLGGAEEFFYWTVVNFGLKDTVRVNHVIIYPQPAGPEGDVAYVIATKQLYASHYLHTSLELRFLLDDGRNGRPGTTLVSLTRSRNDGMTGFRGLFLRSIIRRRSRDGVARYLEHVKNQVERPAAEAF